MSIEIETKTDFEIECEKCGSQLEASLGGKYSWSRDIIKVKPCEQCLKEAREEWAQEGGVE
ncbi:hypothetical protein ACLIIZ_03265 [Azonexus caeni]|uniref:hypothetical protein n=1 Tax=Azonexus caeni TaxID=266126 RepID=UPI003A8855B8